MSDLLVIEFPSEEKAENAALFLLIRRMTTDKVLAALRSVGGTVLRGSFDATKEDALQAALAGVQASSATAAT